MDSYIASILYTYCECGHFGKYHMNHHNSICALCGGKCMKFRKAKDGKETQAVSGLQVTTAST